MFFLKVSGQAFCPASGFQTWWHVGILKQMDAWALSNSVRIPRESGLGSGSLYKLHGSVYHEARAMRSLGTGPEAPGVDIAKGSSEVTGRGSCPPA